MHLKNMQRKFLMKWFKKFNVNMPSILKSVCNNYIKAFDHEPLWVYKSVADSKMWVIPPLGENRVRLDDGGASDSLTNIRSLVSDITGLTLEEKTPILAIWRFDKNFSKCPIHIDIGTEHTGSIVTCISGNFDIHLHAKDEPDSHIIETVSLDDSNLVALNNTVFPHSVEGEGTLIVFGTDKRTNPEEYFRNV
tara:strand:- start:430 stop:1008 length:579 start_codon:yes stop_codon:yes gene_type:complete